MPLCILGNFRSNRRAQLQRLSHELVWEALLHTSFAVFQFRRSGARAVSIAPLVTFSGMVLACRRPKVWRSPSWSPMSGMGVAQMCIYIYISSANSPGLSARVYEHVLVSGASEFWCVCVFVGKCLQTCMSPCTDFH